MLTAPIYKFFLLLIRHLNSNENPSSELQRTQIKLLKANQLIITTDITDMIEEKV